MDKHLALLVIMLANSSLSANYLSVFFQFWILGFNAPTSDIQNDEAFGQWSPVYLTFVPARENSTPSGLPTPSFLAGKDKQWAA